MDLLLHKQPCSLASCNTVSLKWCHKTVASFPDSECVVRTVNTGRPIFTASFSCLDKIILRPPPLKYTKHDMKKSQANLRGQRSNSFLQLKSKWRILISNFYLELPSPETRSTSRSSPSPSLLHTSTKSCTKTHPSETHPGFLPHATVPGDVRISVGGF